MATTATDQSTLKNTLGLKDATLIVAGSMIGSGIFIVSADMTRMVGTGPWLILLWIITGIMTVFAAVSYGELSAMFPKAGGQYVFLREAYNPLTGFLYGWSFFTVIQTGTIAAVGVAFSKFAGYFVPALNMTEENVILRIGSWLTLYPAQLVSIALIIFLTWVNTRGIKDGKLIQRVFTLAKLLSLFGLIIFGLLLAAKASVWDSNWSSGLELKFTRPVMSEGTQIGWSLFETPATLLVAIGLISSAMVGSVFSSVAWENVTFIAGEVRNPKRNVGLSLFLGTIIVTVVYVLTNLMYVAVLPMTPEAAAGAVPYALESVEPTIAFPRQDRVATAASVLIFGDAGTIVIAIMIMISTFGCNNGLILTGARVYYTMAKDKLFLPKAAALNRNGVPGWALWAQCIWASVLCLSGKYGLLLDYVVFITLVFYILTIWGIFRLRKTRPDAERPYKAWGYPYIPVIYMLLAGIMAFGLLYAKWETSVLGLVIVLIGIPVYFIAGRGKSAA